MRNILVFLFAAVFMATTVQATEQDRTAGKAGVTANITDNSAGDITPAKLRTELNDLWDSSVLQGELETLVDPIIDAAMVGGETGTANEYLYTPTDGTCTTDMSTELEAFLTTHDGVAYIKSGSCVRLDNLGESTNYTFANTVDLNLFCEVPGTCAIGNVNTAKAIKYYVSDGVALDSKTLVLSVGVADINRDDKLQYVEVSSTTGYNVGDFAKLVNFVPIPNLLGTVKNVSNIAWDGTKCIVTTSSAHGVSSGSTDVVYLKNITSTVPGDVIDYLDGSDGYGRSYNTTYLTSTTFSIETIDNSLNTSTASKAGAVVDCSGSTYAAPAANDDIMGKNPVWASEDVKVAGVDPIRSRIYFSHRLQLAPLYVQQPLLFRYTEARKVRISGIDFRAIGDTGDLTASVSEHVIDIKGVPRPIYDDLNFYDLFDAAIFTRSTPGFHARNLRAHKLYNIGVAKGGTNVKLISNIDVNPETTFTSNTHGFSNNTAIILGGMPTGFTSFEDVGCRVSDQTANTFKCKDTYGNYLNSSTFSPAFAGTATVGEKADVRGLGYLITTQSGNISGVLDGAYAEEGRHLLTTGESSLSYKAILSTTDDQITGYGVPTYNTYMNMVSSSANGRAIDEHEGAYGNTYMNATVYYPMRGTRFGSYDGACGQFRGDQQTIINFNCIGGEQGIRFPARDESDHLFNTHFRKRQATIDGLKCTNLYGSKTINNDDDEDHCLELGSEGSSSGWEETTFSLHVDIKNMSTKGVSIPIFMGKTTSITASDLDFQDYDDGVDCGAGATFKAENIVSNHGNPYTETGTWTHKTDVNSDGFNLIKMRSDATYNGCNAYINTLTNTQGTGTNELEDIFEAADATATKNWYLGSYTEHDPNSIGAARITEAASGFTQLTTSSVVFVENPAIVANDNAFSYLSSVSADAGSTLVLTGQGASSQGVEIDPNNNGGTFEYRFRPDVFRFTPEDSTSASTRFQLVTTADTSLLTGEASQGVFGSAVTRTHDTGSYTNQREWRFVCPTHAYDGASTVDDAACLYVGGAPTAGTNATFTRTHGLWVDNGISRFDQGVYARNVLTTLNTGGAASTPTTNESGTFYINTGATALTNVTLPGANVTDGAPEYSACVLDIDGIRFTAAAGDVIRYAATVSGSGGYIQSTTIGDCFTLIATDTTNWLVKSAVGAGIAVSP